jgi:asparagine synthase (glutamine-hydrolysing)
MGYFCAVAGLPIDDTARSAFERIAGTLPFGGPTRYRSWQGRRAALAHVPLWPRAEESTAQPAALHSLRLVGDIRLDDPVQLRSALRGAGVDVDARCTDPQLVLHAYVRWGEQCLSRLTGDFAFALWDEAACRLFCARDPLGVKPLFRARLRGGGWAVSNALDALRMHPGVDSALDDEALAEFLLFEAPVDPSRTVYTGIARVPAACSVTFANDAPPRQSSYWEPQFDTIDDRLRVDHVEELVRLLHEALAVRLPPEGGALLMSGGLDSTALAALARELRPSAPLEAFTVTYEHLVPDEEARFARAAAQHLGIESVLLPADHFGPFDQYVRFGSRPPEPLHEPDGGIYVPAYREPARRHKVLLTGYDGDALLADSPKPYLRRALSQGRWLKAGLGAAHYALLERRVLPKGWRRRAMPIPGETDLPEWLSPDLAKRYALKERWDAHIHAQPRLESLRPYAERSLGMLARDSRFFERFDPAVTGERIECRHPFMDLRVVRFCLALPPIPWCVRKEILRRAMRGRLPPAVLHRPKTPMRGSPLLPMLQRPDAAWVDAFHGDGRLARYVRTDKIPQVHRERSLDRAWLNLRPLSLGLWLDQTPTFTTPPTP